jgi:hypothetical protein
VYVIFGEMLEGNMGNALKIFRSQRVNAQPASSRPTGMWDTFFMNYIDRMTEKHCYAKRTDV